MGLGLLERQRGLSFRIFASNYPQSKMNINQYLRILLVVACLMTCSCRRWYENRPKTQKEFIEYANERFRGIVEANGYSTSEFYPGELFGGYESEVESNVRKRRTWQMTWKYRTENWSVGIGLTEDGESLYFDDKPDGFDPKPGLQREIKWLQQKPEQ
jgi:hypothetical protein